MSCKHAKPPFRLDRGGGHAPNSIVCAESFHKRGHLRNPKTGISTASFSDEVCENLGDPDSPVVAANIALLIASPLLAEALRAIVAWMDENGESKTLYRRRDYRVVADARAALAAAGIEEA